MFENCHHLLLDGVQITVSEWCVRVQVKLAVLISCLSTLIFFPAVSLFLTHLVGHTKYKQSS